MRRRAFLAFASGALTLLRDPSQARAPGKIGYLHPRTAAPDLPTVTVLRAAWERLGYTEPDTVLLRSAENDPRRLPNSPPNSLTLVRACLSQWDPPR